MKKRDYDDDDGRTIVDMSEIETPPLFLPKFSRYKKGFRREESGDKDSAVNMTSSERRATVFAAIGASLLIVGVFAAAAAGLIAFLILIWT